MNQDDRRIRSLRTGKGAVDPWRPIDVLLEDERLPGGGRAAALTVFLAGSECPFTCVFCDLWRHTLDGPTPPGAIPAQLREAFGRHLSELPAGAHVKLYNASNFFDDRAVPPSDDAEIAALLEPFDQVVVECHPRLVRRRSRDFAERLRGRLQIAMGLETVHPEALPRLNKKASLADFDRAASTLTAAGIGLRAFVLVGTPFVSPAEAVDWTERSVVHAFERGAEHVSLLPLRPGNGEMERLRRLGAFSPPTLEMVEDALDRCSELGPGVVTVDTWDLERFASCPSCRAERLARLQRINLSGVAEPRVLCGDCRDASGPRTVDSTGPGRISSGSCSKKDRPGTSTVLDELSEIDTAAIEELSRIKEETELLEGRLARMEEEKDQVSSAVYERVKADYESRCRELDEKARPLKERAREEYAKVRALEDRLREDLDAARLEREELEFRHRLGEYDDETYQERLGAGDKTLSEREGKLGELEEVKRRFVGAVRSAEELEGGADVAAEADGPRETRLEEVPEEEPGPPEDELDENTTSTSEIPEILGPIDAESRESPENEPSDDEATVLLKGPRLLIHRGDGVEELRLGTDPVTVGRAIKNDVRFLSTSVSRHHAQIAIHADGYTVSDLGSGNGTLVNGEPVSGERQLRGGDMIQVGSEVLIFREK